MRAQARGFCRFGKPKKVPGFLAFRSIHAGLGDGIAAIISGLYECLDELSALLFRRRVAARWVKPSQA